MDVYLVILSNDLGELKYYINNAANSDQAITDAKLIYPEHTKVEKAIRINKQEA